MPSVPYTSLHWFQSVLCQCLLSSGLQAGLSVQGLWSSDSCGLVSLTLMALKANLRHLSVLPSLFSPVAFGEPLLRLQLPQN